MFKATEMYSIFLVGLILALTISLLTSLDSFLYALLAILIIIFTNIFFKKITAYHLESEIETKIWGIKRYGTKAHWHLKKEFPAGAFFPIIITALTMGYVYWMANFVFEVKPKVYRAAKRWGLYAFSEMTEWHIALIAASGIVINLVLAFVGYVAGFPDFARFNIYYATFNMLPFSDLDGNKILFGSVIMWSFLAIVTLIALGYAFLLI